MDFRNFLNEPKFQSVFEYKFDWLAQFYTSLVLPFDMEHQTQSNWCWAATSKSVSKFYSALSPWTQCKIASSELGLTCCTTPVPSPCNVPWYLDRALTRTNNFVSVTGPISWDAIRQELNNGLVVGARIGWNGGGGHFMVIYGVSSIGSTKYVNIDDPIYGKSLLTYDQFTNNYQGNGRWTTAYFTKKYTYYMWFKDLIFNANLLNPIHAVRPFIDPVPKDIREGVPQNAAANLTTPHHAFIVGLDQLKDNYTLSATPNSLRIIEVKDNTAAALFELGLNEASPELMHMSVSSAYLKQLDSGIGKLKAFAKQSDQTGELRFIKIPALNVEAFWLHYDDSSKDIISPIKKFESDNSFEWDKPYSEKEFMILLQKLASNIDLTDNLIGS